MSSCWRSRHSTYDLWRKVGTRNVGYSNTDGPVHRLTFWLRSLNWMVAARWWPLGALQHSDGHLVCCSTVTATWCVAARAVAVRCTVRCTVIRYGSVRAFFTVCLKIGTVYTVRYGTVNGTVPSWHCQCKNGLRMASPSQNLPFSPPACSSHVLTPHNPSLDDPEAGLGLHQLGGRAQQGLAWKLKVGRGTWF